MRRIKVIIILLTAVFCAGFSSKAQNKEVLFTIDGRESVTADEFMRMYQRNSSTVKDNTPIEDYLNLYINYKLKLLQAHDIGLDKDSSTIKQVQEYRSSLIKPYVNDPKVMDSLALQAYDRLHTLVRASQILISVPANIPPQDTVQYYKKAMEVYQKALQGYDFAKLADEYSDDPSANPQKGAANHGDLGYFTSMTMIYPFEEACYSLCENLKSAGNTLKDSITTCKSQYGYHIIKLTSVKKVSFSAITFEHIFINSQTHSEQEAKDLIYQAYEQIPVLGMDSVVKMFSDDKFSLKSGGILANQKPNVIPAEYIDMFFKYSSGEITEPFQTRFGWHIVKFINSAPIPDFEIVKDQIYQRISKDARAAIAIDRFIDKSKNDYGFKKDGSALRKLENFVTDSVFSATWQLPDESEDKDFAALRDKFLFSIGDKSYTCMDMAEYIFENQSKSTPTHIQTYLNTQFVNYSNKCILDYATQHIGEQYPQIDSSVQEFNNGVLIFDLTDKMVWNKSLSDTVALEEYYQANKSKYLYTERADAVIWTLDKAIDMDKTLKYILKNKKKGKSNTEIKDALCKKYKYNQDEANSKIGFVWGRFEQGANSVIDKNIFTQLDNLKKEKVPCGLIDTTSMTNRNVVIILSEIMPISEKPLSACKGLVTSDYQEVLEKRWMEELHDKYKVHINYDVLNSLK